MSTIFSKRTKIVGVTYDDCQQFISELFPGDDLELRREPDNPSDPNAIAVYNEYGDHLGYLKADLARDLAPMLDGMPRCKLCGSVIGVTGGKDQYFGCNIEIDLICPNCSRCGAALTSNSQVCQNCGNVIPPDSAPSPASSPRYAPRAVGIQPAPSAFRVPIAPPAPSNAFYRGAVPPYPKNSVGIHVLLLLFTGGIGNIIYLIYISNQQKKWMSMYHRQ